LGKTNKVGVIQWSSIIATLSTTVLAVTALITVYLTVVAWRIEQNTARPYFIIVGSPKITLDKEINIELKLNNVGIHPAVNLSSETVVFDEELIGKPIHHDESAIVDEIPKGASAGLLMMIPSFYINPNVLNIGGHYVVVDLQYSDPILNRIYGQSMYLKWNGVQNGKVQPTEHVRVEEKGKILDYFQKQDINLKVRE
jgi:hypothetical protein